MLDADAHGKWRIRSGKPRLRARFRRLFNRQYSGLGAENHGLFLENLSERQLHWKGGTVERARMGVGKDSALKRAHTLH